MESQKNSHHQLIRIPSSKHQIDESKICHQARFVVDTLLEANYQAYLVGGCVRDLVLGLVPKDFDIATNARPEQICELFDNSRLIGRRFQIVHIYFKRNYIEVSTFRASKTEDNQHSVTDASGRIVRDNTFGTIEQDALRRDFTINALYYDTEKSEVLDYCSGYDDLITGKISTIGDAATRYREDPVRMLRALRFQAKLDLELDNHTKQPIKKLGSLLQDIPPARLFDEVIKLFHSGYALRCFQELQRYKLLPVLFPVTHSAMQHNETFSLLIFAALENTDSRIASGKSVNPAFIFSILLWQPYLQLLKQTTEQGIPYTEGAWSAGRTAVLDQSSITTIPKRFSITICEIWKLQQRFKNRHHKKAIKFLTHPRFRAAYDFMCLRVHSGEVDQADCQWWTEIQTNSNNHQDKKSESATKRPRRRKQRP